ncbi:hypothetical protein COO60DRAFT_642489 [Scenedesmus sp. NREL 46B-D3]|nr:hypothetical protein COO60DRAFT_642489 [Scenedesmus sp. NREL 46B-D3]
MQNSGRSVHHRYVPCAVDMWCLCCRCLEVLAITHNCLQDLPEGLYTLTTLRDVNASYNQLDFISNNIGNTEGLHVLNLAGNQLRAIPSDVGWLGLKQLNISDNPDLNIPAHVLQCGFKAVMSYLQVVGEQHQLVEHHMAAFTARFAELRKKHGLHLGSLEDAAGVSLQLKVAQRLGILSCRGSRMAVLPAALDAKQPALEGVQVVDCSRNRLRALPQQMLQAMPRLVVLNMSYNSLKSLPAGVTMSQLSVLDLSFNKLALLPAELGQQMPGLQQLYLANNYLKELPASLGQMTGLQDLFLSENGFEEVPQVLLRCSSLVKLSLAACQLTAMADELQDLAGLRCGAAPWLPGSSVSTRLLCIKACICWTQRVHVSACSATYTVHGARGSASFADCWMAAAGS